MMKFVPCFLAAAALFSYAATFRGRSICTVCRIGQEETAPEAATANNSTALLRKASCPRPGEIKYFQLYHISEDRGGIGEVLSVLRDAFRLDDDISLEEGDEVSLWHAEQRQPQHENRSPANDDDEHNNNNNNKASFVVEPVRGDPTPGFHEWEAFTVTLVQNPFSYYRSLFSSLVNQDQEDSKVKEDNCGYKLARNFGWTGIFSSHGGHDQTMRNRNAFEAFVRLIIKEKKGHYSRGLCDEGGDIPADMQGRHYNLVVGRMGVGYDAFIRQEHYEADLRRALETFDDCLPDVADLGHAFESRKGMSGSAKVLLARNSTSWLREHRRTEQRQQASSSSSPPSSPPPPDYCYYSPELRSLVEENDSEIMERYGYSWSTFVGSSGSVEDDCDGIL